MKEAELDEVEVEADRRRELAVVRRMYTPEKGEGAEMLDGSAEEIAEKIAALLKREERLSMGQEVLRRRRASQGRESPTSPTSSSGRGASCSGERAALLTAALLGSGHAGRGRNARERPIRLSTSTTSVSRTSTPRPTPPPWSAWSSARRPGLRWSWQHVDGHGPGRGALGGGQRPAGGLRDRGRPGGRQRRRDQPAVRRQDLRRVGARGCDRSRQRARRVLSGRRGPQWTARPRSRPMDAPGRRRPAVPCASPA